MTDLLTKMAVRTDIHTDLPFVVNEFQRVKVPARKPEEQVEFQKLPCAKQQALMERLIDRVKEL